MQLSATAPCPSRSAARVLVVRALQGEASLRLHVPPPLKREHACGTRGLQHVTVLALRMGGLCLVCRVQLECGVVEFGRRITDRMCELEKTILAIDGPRRVKRFQR